MIPINSEVLEKYKSIPMEMKQLPQWVGFIREPRVKDGKPKFNKDGSPSMTKIPVDVHTFSGASSTKASQWAKFDEAVNAIGRTATVKGKSGTVEGMGFVFRPQKDTDTGICGIDLDHIIDPNTGEINAAALEIIQAMDSYTEYSPSGTGVHIYYYGANHSEWKNKIEGALGVGTCLEMYQTERYFTVTGKVFGELKPIAEREQQAAEIQSRYAPKPQEKPIIFSPVEISSTTALSDDEVIDKAGKSKSGTKFMALLGGDLSDYDNDQSRADQMANFCNQFDKVCTELSCAVIYCHHHSKGSQGAKKSMDRVSGSGVFARDPDALLDLTQLEISDTLLQQQEDEMICRICKNWISRYLGVSEKTVRNRLKEHGEFWIDGGKTGLKGTEKVD